MTDVPRSTAVREYDVRTGDDGTSFGTLRRRSVTPAIVETIAELEGTDPADLPPLSDRLDPESVDRLLRSSGRRDGSGFRRLSFRYLGYDVTVRSPSTIEIRDAGEARPRDDA